MIHCFDMYRIPLCFYEIVQTITIIFYIMFDVQKVYNVYNRHIGLIKYVQFL